VISTGIDLTQDCEIDNPIDNLNRNAFANIRAYTTHLQEHGALCLSLICPPTKIMLLR
jgi:hypothetical protein